MPVSNEYFIKSAHFDCETHPSFFFSQSEGRFEAAIDLLGSVTNGVKRWFCKPTILGNLTLLFFCHRRFEKDSGLAAIEN